MKYDQYRFKFYFNASHAIYLSGEIGESHSHTWEVILNVMKVTDNFVLFNDVEKMCESFLEGYQDVFINKVQPFTTINPTLENICTYFKEKLQELLHEKGWLLLSIELSETPSRSYVISVTDELESRKSSLGQEYNEALQDIIDRVTKEKIEVLSKEKIYPKKEQEKELKELEKKVTKPGNRIWRKFAGKK